MVCRACYRKCTYAIFKLYLRNISQHFTVDGTSECEAEGVATGSHHIAHHKLGYSNLNRRVYSTDIIYR